MANNTKVDNRAASVMERLKIIEMVDFKAALRGESVPHALGLRLTTLCIVRGIRYHYGFAQELHGTSEIFTRALNARSIMSNIMPDMSPDRLEDFPYCIWHPEVASENTYRELAQRYPQMAYHVGRACAVAGYTDLFLELDLLPEVHIAEEARECGHMAIFNAIMVAPVKYKIMDDYTRSVDIEHPQPASLNGDTAVRRFLEFKQDITPYLMEESMEAYKEDTDYLPINLFLSEGFHDSIFNITEDMNVAEKSSDFVLSDYYPPPRIYDIITLMYTPLPLDLPTVDKDELIFLAAHYGNIDRYSRLRRPMMVGREINFVIRGIYHNTMFAKWWSFQTIKDSFRRNRIESAINARFIMNNDLSRVCDPSHVGEPYMIWYPTVAAETTYRELARRKPKMKPQILRASMVANYRELFDELVNDVKPDLGLKSEALSCKNRYYIEVLKKRISDLGLNLDDSYCPEWMTYSCQDHPRTSPISLSHTPSVSAGWIEGYIYDGLDSETGQLEVYVCVPRELMPPDASKSLDYVEWPPRDDSLPTDKEATTPEEADV